MSRLISVDDFVYNYYQINTNKMAVIVVYVFMYLLSVLITESMKGFDINDETFRKIRYWYTSTT